MRFSQIVLSKIVNRLFFFALHFLKTVKRGRFYRIFNKIVYFSKSSPNCPNFPYIFQIVLIFPQNVLLFPKLSLHFPNYPYISQIVLIFPNYPYISQIVVIFPKLSLYFPNCPNFPQIVLIFLKLS